MLQMSDAMAETARLLERIGRIARRAGGEVVYRALLLAFVVRRPDVPWKVKAPILGALAYLPLPMDAVPDFLPGLGFSDDLTVIAGALAMAAMFINDDVRARARAQYRAWFGTEPPSVPAAALVAEKP